MDNDTRHDDTRYGDAGESRPGGPAGSGTGIHLRAAGPDASASRPADDLRISVEAAAPEYGTGVGADRPGGAEHEDGPIRCPHRVRLRNLRFGIALACAATVLVLILAMAVHVGALFTGGFLVSLGAEFLGGGPVLTGTVLVLGAMLGTVGSFAAFGTWRRLHRPEPPILAVSTAGAVLVLFGATLFGRWIDLHWFPVLAVPTALTAGFLWYCRGVLAPRDTCEDDPGLTVQVRAMRRAARTETATQFAPAPASAPEPMPANTTEPEPMSAPMPATATANEAEATPAIELAPESPAEVEPEPVVDATPERS